MNTVGEEVEEYYDNSGMDSQLKICVDQKDDMINFFMRRKIISHLKRFSELERTKQREGDILDFINWFGSWQTDKCIDDYGVNDIAKLYAKDRSIDFNKKK